MKKVLFVANTIGHINTFHKPCMEWFKSQGWMVHVAAKVNREVELPCDKVYDVCIERYPYKLNNIRAYRKIRKLIETEKYDLVYCHTPMGGILGRLASVKARKKHNTKVVYMCHGFQFYKGGPKKDWLLYYPIEYLFAKICDGIITINSDDYRLAKKMGTKSYKVPGVGVDLDRFYPDEGTRITTRKELGINEEDFVLLSVGELNENKNHEVVIKALGKLNNSRIKYYVAGDGHLSDYLNDIIKEHNLERNVFLLGRRSDIPDLCNAADMFVFPSKREGLPISPLEAMATGKPVIASSIRGVTEYVIHSETGLLCGDNVDEYANAINNCILNTDELKVMGNNAILKSKEFSVENSIKSITMVLRKFM